MAGRRSGRVFIAEDERAFLDAAGRWRAECVSVLARAPIGGPVYKAAGGIMDAIDGLAEVVTGDRMRFHGKPPTTPGPRLPPVKWRTVE